VHPQAVTPLDLEVQLRQGLSLLYTIADPNTEDLVRFEVAFDGERLSVRWQLVDQGVTSQDSPLLFDLAAIEAATHWLTWSQGRPLPRDPAGACPRFLLPRRAFALACAGQPASAPLDYGELPSSSEVLMAGIQRTRCVVVDREDVDVPVVHVGCFGAKAKEASREFEVWDNPRWPLLVRTFEGEVEWTLVAMHCGSAWAMPDEDTVARARAPSKDPPMWRQGTKRAASTTRSAVSPVGSTTARRRR
jgi:hypothetical protein